MTHTALLAVDYVTTAPFFWASMGFTTAIAMFIGVVIYDGEVPKAKRGLISVLAYGSMLVWTTLARVIPVFYEKIATEDPTRLEMNKGQVFANPVTIAFLTVFWILGVYIGVKIIHRAHKL